MILPLEFVFTLACTVAISAHADIITVTNTNDSGPGSLRQALVDANDGDTINFAVTGTIGLTSGELLVDHAITISGPRAENLAVNGNAKSTAFPLLNSEQMYQALRTLGVPTEKNVLRPTELFECLGYLRPPRSWWLRHQLAAGSQCKVRMVCLVF